MAEPGTGKEGEPKTKPPTVHTAGDFFYLSNAEPLYMTSTAHLGTALRKAFP